IPWSERKNEEPRKMGGTEVKISYDDRTDLLYLRFDERKQEVENKRVSDDVVLDIGAGGKIIGIGILDASLRLDLELLLPVRYGASKAG
ncbi:MAG: DUF2283 domain-containing protein, partial [Nitrospiraceae bacterium]